MPSAIQLIVAAVAVAAVIIPALLRLRSRQGLREAPYKNRLIPRAYTVEELAQFDGTKNPLVFIGVKGILYSASREWYGPGSPYNDFAGCDSSRHLGKVVVGRDEANADWTNLSPSHMQSLNEWEEKLGSKYPIVGWVTDPNGDFVKRGATMTP